MNKIYVYFLLLCFPVRLLIAYLADKIQNTKYIYYYVFLTFFIGISFLYQYFKNYRKKGAFSQKIWWQNYRIIHAFNFIIYSILVMFSKKYKKHAHKFLYIDAFLGLLFFIHNHI